MAGYDEMNAGSTRRIAVRRGRSKTRKIRSSSGMIRTQRMPGAAGHGRTVRPLRTSAPSAVPSVLSYLCSSVANTSWRSWRLGGSIRVFPRLSAAPPCHFSIRLSSSAFATHITKNGRSEPRTFM